MAPLDIALLTRVTGGKSGLKDWDLYLDDGVSKVYPGWGKLSCTSRGMWVGTAAGSVTGAAASALASPAVGSGLAPIAGTLASTQYIEACQARQGGKPSP